MRNSRGERRVPYAMSVARTVKFPALVASVGRCALSLFPERIARFRRGDLPERLTRLDKLLLAGLISQHRRDGTFDELDILFEAFWRADSATDYHRRVADRFDRVFLRHHAEPLRSALVDAMVLTRTSYHTVCEIGCGSGQLLNWWAEQLPNIEQFIGLDLSAAQTEENRRRWEKTKLRFESGEGAAWIAANASPGWVIVTYGGVFEYFTRHKLMELFGLMSRHHAPCVLAMVEPLADDHDLDTDRASKSYGYESTFSHNYLHLLARSGWSVTYRMDEVVGRQRWLTLVAVTRDAIPERSSPASAVATRS